MKLLILITFLLLSCKPRANLGGSLKGEDLNSLSANELENFRQNLTKVLSATSGIFELDANLQSRRPNVTLSDLKQNTNDRQQIENHFGPSEFLEHKFFLDLKRNDLKSDDLMTELKGFYGTQIKSIEFEENVTIGLETIEEFSKREAIHFNHDFKLDPDKIEKLKREGIGKDLSGGYRGTIGNELPELSSPISGIQIMGNKSTIVTHDGLEWVLSTTRKNRLYTLILRSAPSKTIKAMAFYKFLDHLKNSPLFKRSFALRVLVNPHFKDEIETFKALKTRTSRTLQSIALTDLSTDASKSPGTYLLPDIHNQSMPLYAAMSLIQNQSWDWMALEVPMSCQTDVNRIINGESTPCLDDFFSKIDHRRIWNTQGAAKNFGNYNKNEFRRLIEIAILKNIDVIFMDAKVKYKSGWPFSDLLSFKTRNFLFAKNASKPGRGIIFGGAWHFYDSHANVQDFLPRTSKVRIIEYR